MVTDMKKVTGHSGDNRITGKQKLPMRALACLLTAVATAFLAVRAKGFLIQWRGLDCPIWLFGGVAVLATAAVLLFGVPAWVRAYGARLPWSIGIYAISMLLAIAGRGMFCARAIDGTGISMHGYAQAVYVMGSGVLLGFFLNLTLPALKRAIVAIWRLICSLQWWDFLYLGLLLILCNFCVWEYAAHSSTIYFWDSAGYWKLAQILGEQWKNNGLLSLLRTVYDSVLTSDYNYIIVLPHVLFYRLFGGSRLVYLLAIANFGYFPFCAELLCLCRAHCRRWKLVFPVAVLALPMVFYNVLVGFVDVAGCVFTLAACFLYLEDRGRNRFDIFLLAGICLAVSILLRRWFSFLAVAFVAALILDCSFSRRSAMPVLGTVGALAFVLGYFFQPFVSEKMLADYKSLYAAYMIGLDKDFLLLFRYYGIVLLGLLLIGAIILLCDRKTRSTAAFFCGQLLICFLLFVKIQTHGQQHMLLYVAPVCVLLLLSAGRLTERWKSRSVAAVLLCASLLHTLSPFLLRVQPTSLDALKKPTLLPSFSWSAPKNVGAETYVSIVRRLDEVAADGATVGVLAASLELNTNLLGNTLASLSLPGGDAPRSYLVYLPEVDQRDGWKDLVFSCDYLLVADPVQVHLGLENEQVIALPAQALLSQSGMGNAYEKMDDHWTLPSGADVYLYRRTRDVTEDEKAELRAQFSAAHENAPIS